MHLYANFKGSNFENPTPRKNHRVINSILQTLIGTLLLLISDDGAENLFANLSDRLVQF